MKIMTITQTDPRDFDPAVNAALADGWHLTERRLVQTPAGSLDYFYAEMVLPDPQPEPVELDLFAAAEAVRQECTRHESCTTCPLGDICTCLPPHEWQGPDHD